MVPTIEWKDQVVRLLDQSQLPQRVEILECRHYLEVAQAIRELRVRGAPAIGIAAAFGVALGAQSIMASELKAFQNSLYSICDELAATRPTAVNLFWALNRMKAVLDRRSNQSVMELKKALLGEALEIHVEDVARNQKIGRHGASLIQDGQHVLTHCNAGALATGGYGTALGVVRSAWEEGKKIRVFVDETRPVLQGARLTTWELLQDGIPVTLITDNAAGALMRQGLIHLCLVGADRIAANGDVANKIGTYTVALLANAHGLPFYVAAPSSTIDLGTPTGMQIPIEERLPHEVTTVNSYVSIAPAEVEVLNPAFDITPADLITAIITEQGVFVPQDIATHASGS